jgi:hypothetical protein
VGRDPPEAAAGARVRLAAAARRAHRVHQRAGTASAARGPCSTATGWAC